LSNPWYLPAPHPATFVTIKSVIQIEYFFEMGDKYGRVVWEEETEE
jgi:hypothetical protein